MHRKPKSDPLPIDSELERTLKRLKESKQSRKSNHGR